MYGFSFYRWVIFALSFQLAPAATSSSTSAWSPLFTGKDLTAWNAPVPNPFWSVKDGVLVGVHDEKLLGSTLWTKNNYRDFILEFEVRWTGDMDSGVMFRAPHLQMQIGVSRSMKRDMTASFYVTGQGYPETGRVGTGTSWLRAPGEWNKLRLQAKGDLFSTWINEHPAVAYRNPGHASPAPIGLSIHAKMKMKVEFRNVRIVVLEEPAAHK